MNISIGKKIFILNILGMIIIGMSGIFLLIRSFNAEEKAKQNELFSFSEQLSVAIEDQFFERYNDVKAFRERFRSVFNNKKEKEETLNILSSLYSIYDLILVTDIKGNLIAVNTKDPSGKPIPSEQLYTKNFATESWYTGTTQKKFLEDKSKGLDGVYFENPQFNPILENVYGKKIYATIFSTPLYNASGNIEGVITAFANFSWVESLFTRVYSILINKDLSHSQMNLINGEGTVILEHDPSTHNFENKIIYDEEILNKLNLTKEKNSLTNDILAGPDRVIEGYNSRKNIPEIIAINIVNGPKIVDSLKWNVLLREQKDEFYSNINQTKIYATIIFTLAFILVTFLSIIFSRALYKKISKIGESLNLSSKKLLDSATQSSSSSHELSSSAVEQASALQETVAAVTEINSMLKRSSETAEKSKEAAEESNQIVNQGKKYILELKDVMSEIKKTNIDVFDEVENGNKQISEIIKVISEIENKTKVINDIVFQTKLLSFNAAVEAARAGEHGKGFAVVAEEVGNLAQMSGQASKEISGMLDQSTNKVKNIITSTSEKVSKMIQNSGEIIKKGEQTTEKCSLGFEKITESSVQINSLIIDISNSTLEQAKGIEEINQAMHELDAVTNQNSMVAQQSSQSSQNLLKQSQEIENLALDLLKTIQGKNEKITTNNFKNDSDNNLKGSTNYFKSKEMNNEDILKIPNESSNKIPSYNDPRFEEL